MLISLPSGMRISPGDSRPLTHAASPFSARTACLLWVRAWPAGADPCGCTVPQSFDSEKPHNVVRGAFARSGQEDWAVLCSAGGRSVVLVFWAGRLMPPPAELGLADDALYLQGIGAGQIGYSRAIGRADTTSIRAHAEAYDGPLPKRLDHDGLEDAFVGKASQILYYENGAWQELAGAD